jgi:hypothetical protein
MPVFDQRDARCRVYTFKEGLLSAIAHDLEIDVSRFRVEHEGDVVRATFEANSLRVLHAMADGRPKPDLLSPRDRQKIEDNILKDVLQATRHPQIAFRAQLAGAPEGHVSGELTLGGRSRQVRVSVRTEETMYVGEVTLHQPDFGITPYSAMLGTLRIKADVRVRIEIPRAPPA